MGQACGCGDLTATKTEEIAHDGTVDGERKPQEQNGNKKKTVSNHESDLKSYQSKTKEQMTRLQ